MQIPDVKSATVAECWASYRRDVMPAAAGAVQIHECQLAFYAGATAMLAGMLAAVGSATVDEEVGISWILAREQELCAFGARIEASGNEKPPTSR